MKKQLTLGKVTIQNLSFRLDKEEQKKVKGGRGFEPPYLPPGILAGTTNIAVYCGPIITD